MTSSTAPRNDKVSDAARKLLRVAIPELRGVLEEDFRKQLTALGVREDGVVPLPAGRSLSPADYRVREAAVAVIEREVKGDACYGHALDLFIRESAYTFLNRVFGLRCLEERGLLLVAGQSEQAIRQDPARGASPLYWRVRNELPPSTNPREVWRETLSRAWIALSERVKLLFDPTSELAALLPLLPTIQRVVELLNRPDVPSESYAQDELLGWVYQYYNTQEKAEVYARLAKGAKLGEPEEIAAATCLYTERYMVDYLLQNSLGALWAAMHPKSDLPGSWPYFVSLPQSAVSDQPGGNGSPLPVGDSHDSPRPLGELEHAAGVDMPVRISTVHEGKGVPTSTTPRWVREITLLDPACGSGHFLVRAFDMLAEMYREEGIEGEAEIPALILERNLHGVDIDARAVHIAALALYIKGCVLAGPRFRPRRLNLVAADVLLPGEAPPAEYMVRFREDPELEALVKGIWQGLKNAREYGSLLHPERAVDAVVKLRKERDLGGLWQHDDAHWELWKLDLLKGLREQFEAESESEDLGQRLFGREAARGVGLGEALGRRYDVVVANPPYQGSGSLNPGYKAFLGKEYADGKRDLYAAFILRCMDFCHRHGRLGMVTQQSWMFLRSFARLRKRVLEVTSLETIAHLGEHAFEETSAAGAFVVLFTLQAAAPVAEHRLTGFRLIGPKSATEKNRLLREAVAGRELSVVSTPRQSDFVSIPETPFVYWLRPKFFELLRSPHRLRDVADVRQGLATADNERFTRYSWEVSEFGVVRDGKPVSGRWFWYAKGGRYQKWAGLEWLVVDWEDNGHAIKTWIDPKTGRPHSNVWMLKGTESRLFFKPGLTYSMASRGSMGCRLLSDAIFDQKAPSVFTLGASVNALAALLCSRTASYLLRIVTQSIDFSNEYVAKLPAPEHGAELLSTVGEVCTRTKLHLAAKDLIERRFVSVELEHPFPHSLDLCRGRDVLPHTRSASFTSISSERQLLALAVEKELLLTEAIDERSVATMYDLSDKDIDEMIRETGTPAGWHPLIVGYDEVQKPPAGVVLPDGIEKYLAEWQRVSLSPVELARLKSRLRAMYQAGSGAKVEEPEDEAGSDEENEVLGGRIPIPAETFLEELSQKLEVHPISIYRLLKEMREQEGLVCPPELKRQMEDYASVSLLRLLGYRWPEQDRHEAEHGPIIDPDLVDDDGIIPLVPCGNHRTAEELIRMRLERDFGEEGAEQSLEEFRQGVGRDLGDWLRREFFKRHVQQFKQRPIAWHLVSPNRTFEAFVLYHKVSRETLQRLRAQYAGGVIERLRADQERARTRGVGDEVTQLQLQIEDVEEFRGRIERIERGDELKYRIRCRWKREEATGRPGPYAPDIDDGVKVNVRPFQEAGVLAIKQVIKKW